MKINIKTQVYCDYENLKKFLPTQYISLVDRFNYGEVVNLVCFCVDKTAITGSEVKKAQQKLSGTNSKTFYFARSFTIEASKLIAENNGAAFCLIDFPWTDERYNRIRGG
ncbi:MAG: hypothetical protein ACI4JK_10670 [Oscillospiraceae bacterium]